MSTVVERAGAKTRRTAAYVVILIAAVYLYHLAGQFKFDYEPGRIGPDAWPKLVLGLLIATCAWQIVRIVVFGARSSPSAIDAVDSTGSQTAPSLGGYAYLAWAGVALTLAYAYLLPNLGFFVSTVLYIASLTYLGNYRRWPLVAISLVAPVALMFIFMRVVYLSLPLGQGIFKDISLALLRLLGVH